MEETENLVLLCSLFEFQFNYLNLNLPPLAYDLLECFRSTIEFRVPKECLNFRGKLLLLFIKTKNASKTKTPVLGQEIIFIG